MGNARLDWQHVEVIGWYGKLTIPAKAGIFAYLGIFSARECERQHGCMELATGPNVSVTIEWQAQMTVPHARVGLTDDWAAQSQPNVRSTESTSGVFS